MVIAKSERLTVLSDAEQEALYTLGARLRAKKSPDCTPTLGARAFGAASRRS